ncbi:Ras-related protein Rab [Acrasis kona]|uniref:Ras-related protein Rab n=1 Tax=Acrasis kona TaxID=1008807 RepID=A0AAW2Z834_9EUKA
MSYPSINEQESHDFYVKVVVTGDSGVGKSNLMSQFTNKGFRLDSKSTIGIEFSKKLLKLDNGTVLAHVWDTAGQERFRSLSATFYRGAKGSLLAYDVTSRQTFINCKTWLKEFRDMADPNAITVLIGNKNDLRHLRAVTVEEGKIFAEQNGLLFLETSALENYNVEEAFKTLLVECTRDMQRIVSDDKTDSVVPHGLPISSLEPTPAAKPCFSCQ